MRQTRAVFLKCLISLYGLVLAKENEVRLLVDVGKTYEIPTVMTTFLCWERRFKANLILELGKLENPISIRFVSGKFNKNMFERVQQDTMFIANLKCPGVLNFLLQVYEVNENIFNRPFRWLIIGNRDNDKIIPPEIYEMNIFISSEVIVARENEHGDFVMDLIYKKYQGGEWLTENYGIWNQFGLQKSQQLSLTTVVRRRNLELTKIPIAYNVDDMEIGVGLENVDSRISKSRHGVTQWGYHVILPLYDFMNATRCNIFTDDWGYYINGSWNGIIKVMLDKEAELSGTPIFLTTMRLTVARYLINPVNTYVRFVFREPPLSYQNNLFLLPFNKAVWCTLSGLVLIMMAVIYANAHWEWKKSSVVVLPDEHYIVATPHDRLSLSDAAMMIVGAITQQGSFVELKGAMGRLVMFILFLAFLFLFTAYSASIVVLLQSTSKQIRTLGDLLNSKLELGSENTSYNVHYFTKATDPVRKAIYQTKIAPRGSLPKFMTTEEGVKKMQMGPFAFNMELGAGYKLVAKYFYEHEKCGLQEIAYLPESKPWLTCRKGSPYEELIKIGLYRIREHGLTDRANRIVFTKKPVCSVSGGSFDSVSIVDVYPPLLMLLYGMLLAFTLLALEIFVHRHLIRRAAKVTNFSA